MMRPKNGCWFMLIACLLLPNVVNGAMFTESGLMDIPTGGVLEHGIFGAGTSLAFENSQDENAQWTHETALRLNFGLFDSVEMGLSHQSRAAGVLAHLKAQLLKESGAIPSVAIGVENLLAEETDFSQTARSEFLVVSKTFNLPKIHLISGHIGIGRGRFASEDRGIGPFVAPFVGISTEFHPAFARGDIAFSLEFDGIAVNAGIRHTATSGLQVALGVETLNNPEEARYLVAISWSNAQVMEQIAAAKRLAKQAALVRKSASNN